MSLALDDSQWPEHLAPLKEVDNLLRCGICFDYFNIAMIIPQCSHNYCSLCIRKTLSYKAQCPTCCVAAVEPDLKNNRMLDDLVKTFNSARQQLFQAVLDSPSVSPPALLTKKAIVKGHILNSSSDFSSGQEFTSTLLVKEQTPRRPFKTFVRESKKIKVKEEEDSYGFEECHTTLSVGASSTSPKESTRQSETPSTSATKVVAKVECPVCGVPVHGLHINAHLDSCLTSDEKKESLRSSGQKRRFLPKVVYNLLSDRDLRKRLKQYGLSTHGTKQQLIKRHQEFVHMYNAQCDSLNPKSVEEIVKELENNERTRAQLESKMAGKDRLTFANHLEENEIDEVHRDYRKKHKAEFQLLIDQMNKRKKKANKIKTEEEEPQQKEAAAENPPLEIGEKQSAAEHPGCSFLADEAVKKEALDCARSPSLHLPEAKESIILSSGSSNSSSSDIIRDLEIAGMRSGSSDKAALEDHSAFEAVQTYAANSNRLPDVKTAKQKSRDRRSSSLQSRSKRRKQ
ncbi:PREDICTED: E3 ubiquitin-protein ligase RAD18 [Gekko japonicus]|uniref:RING-type E3 ubiquitin transferase n=1 Tax=Gekko japonicus TaxID=146911 RepID=A0ABM1KBG5_GEKJA|nr:PREDICTED: E3 ubiquitin-protein ligase RAD18 [Gekko japonicus]